MATTHVKKNCSARVVIDALDEYQTQKVVRSAADAAMKKARKKVSSYLGLESKKGMSITEAEELERVSVTVLDNVDESKVGTVSYYVAQRTSADWVYLRTILSPSQLKKAQKITRFTEVKITPAE